jgi:hypothetical protein
MLARHSATQFLLRCRRLPLLLSALCLVADPARAASYALELRDQNGAPVEHAVLALVPAAGGRPVVSGAARPTAVMDQQRKQFPNSDEIRHHVYSFSAAKRFELKLYKGVPLEPVIFDRPGPVVLGCNIHDRMIGYIYVASTPYLATTGQEGLAKIDGLPAGQYRVEIWHAQLVGESPKPAGGVELTTDSQQSGSAVLELGEAPQRKRALSPLEQKFKDRSAQ